MDGVSGSGGLVGFLVRRVSGFSAVIAGKGEWVGKSCSRETAGEALWDTGDLCAFRSLSLRVHPWSGARGRDSLDKGGGSPCLPDPKPTRLAPSLLGTTLLGV